MSLSFCPNSFTPSRPQLPLNVVLTSSAVTTRSPILRLILRSTLKAVLKDSALLPIFTICIGWILTPLLRNRSLHLRRSAKPEKPNTSAFQSALLQLYARLTPVSFTFILFNEIHQIGFYYLLIRQFVVAHIDAVQSEYSAFETLHEAKGGLFDACKELGVAFVAYSPLGHGWLVDNFDYKSPDDFAPDDFRRTGQSFFCLLVPLLLLSSGNSAEVGLLFSSLAICDMR